MMKTVLGEIRETQSWVAEVDPVDGLLLADQRLMAVDLPAPSRP
jgi:hypothetical protein